MQDRQNERSPLLGETTCPAQEWGIGRAGSKRVQLGETRHKFRKRRCRRQDAVPRARFLPRNWGLTAGVAAIVMLSLALTGLAAIFSAVKGQVTLTNVSTPLTMKEARIREAPAASESRERSVAGSHVGQGEAGKGKEETAAREEKKAGSVSSNKNASTTKPNVFFILIDDMGYDDIGYQSIDLQGTTPYLDKLAAGGVKMKEYYSMAVCTPARASLMTGRYVVRYGLQYGMISTGAPWGLPLTEKIFPQYMKDAGYETHMVGKWHLGYFDEGHIPSQRGFDTHMGYLDGQEMYWTHQTIDAKVDGRKFFDFGFGNATGYYDIIDRPTPDHLCNEDDDETMLSPTTTSSSSTSPSGFATKFKGMYSTQVFQDRAIDVLKQKTPFDEEPLYMYLAHQAVHAPLGLPPDDAFSDDELSILAAIEATSDELGHLRARFAKVLMYLDHTIGELVDYLEAEGWMENSIIAVASDNGGCPINGGSNYPLRGVKNTNWEGGTKVPAFVYSTSHIPEERWGTEYYGMMHVTDWLPTIATAAGIALDGGAGPLDGIDHWEYIVGAGTAASHDDGPRQEMLYNFDPYVHGSDANGSIWKPDFQQAQGAFRSGKYKFVSKEWCSGWFTYNLHAQAVDGLTNINTVCGETPCSDCGACLGHEIADYLFDLEADPREEKNLIDVYPEIAQRIRDRWMETALSDFGNSCYKDVDYRSYDVWIEHNWWVVPWWDQVENVA